MIARPAAGGPDSARGVVAFAGPDSARGDSAASAFAALHAESLLATSAVPRDYLAEVRANFTAENRAYAGTRVLLECVEPVLVVLLMLLLLFSGASARLRDIAHAMGHRRYVRVLVYFTLFSVVTFLLTLPLAWYRGFALEHQYGLSTQGFGDWFADQLKDVGFSVLFIGVVPLVALAYRAIEKHPRTWWLWLAGGTLPVILAATLFGPLVYEPSFNKVRPLSDPALRGEILELAARAGIPGRNVFEINRSEQTVKYNAYVSGFGASQRIVLWDTMLKGMERDEILFVMGHEMGHYRLHHIWKGIAFFSLLSVALFFLLRLGAAAALRRFGARWHVADLHDVATLPLFVIVLTVLSLAVRPATAAYSRSIEHEADVFALEVTRDNDAGARAFLKLGAQNRNDPEPDPLVRLWLYEHPPLGERIRFALEYRPWERGEPNRAFR